MHLLTCVDEELRQCEVCQDFEKAPHAPVAGTSTGAVFARWWISLARLISSPRMLRTSSPSTPPSYRLARKSPGGLGRLLQFADWKSWPSILRPDGCGWGMEE